MPNSALTKALAAFLTISTGVFTSPLLQAAPILNTNSSSGAFPVSNGDLLEGILGTVGPGTLNGQEGTSSNPAILTNGAFGTGGGPLDLGETVSIGNNTTITWQLDTIASPLGYDITGINTYSGWRDAGRDRQDYTARYATVAAPGTFIDIISVAGFNPSPSNSGESLITDSTGTLATGVGGIQFFFPGQENGYVGYREIDVFGSAIAAGAVPEPSTLLQFAAVLAGIWFARRNRKARG